MEQKQEEKVVIETPTKKGRFIFYFALFFVYLIGVGIVWVNKPDVKTEVVNNNAKIIPTITRTEITINPPSQALTGSLNILNNNIKILPRFKNNWEDVATTSSILQEEKIQTDETGIAKIEFPSQLTLTINPSSEIDFANLLPDSFLVEQSKGTVSYTVEKPVSVKSIDTLTLFQPGKATLEIDPDYGLIYLNIASGSAKFSFIDNDNQTQVFEIEKGNRVIYNSENTSITIR